MELFLANHQWSTRPADQRFDSLADMHAATKAYAASAREIVRPWSSLRVEADGQDVVLLSTGGTPARITHYAFGQLVQRAAIEAPDGKMRSANIEHLRSLPPTLACQVLNHGLKARKEDDNAALLMHANGSFLLRAALSTNYSRLWNHEVVERLIDVSDRNGLVPARATFRVFDAKNPPALYASDHDMFAFLMSNKTVTDPTGQTMRRGVIVVNSEVGDSSLRVIGFYFREICGNHIIWGAHDIAEIRYTHRGEIGKRWADAQIQVRKYLEGAESLEQARFRAATLVIPGATKDQVLDAIFGKRIVGLTKKVLSASYDAVVPDVDGNPATLWGMAQGITRHSQTLGYADERAALDRAAGKLLDVATF